ncbi:MAG: response regulator [Aquabacterium sp.]|nr:response regulator [Aquabacterium sp.]
MTAAARALVVDDNRLNSRLVHMFLGRMGVQVHVAGSGAQALDALKQDTFNLIVLDLRMPQMSGEQVCGIVRQMPGLLNLPVVAYTAHRMPDEQARLLAAGFTDLLTKPLSFTDVKRLCERLGIGWAGQ